MCVSGRPFAVAWIETRRLLGNEQGIKVAPSQGRGLKHDPGLASAQGAMSPGVPVPVLKTLKMPDYMRVAEVVVDFFGGSQPTGEKD